MFYSYSNTCLNIASFNASQPCSRDATWRYISTLLHEYLLPGTIPQPASLNLGSILLNRV